jgi:hypothetical protein
VTLGVWLLAVGVCDLMRAARDTTTWRRRWLLVLTGLALLVLAAVALRLPPLWWGTVGVCWGVGLVAWVLASSLALDRASTRRGLWRAVAMAAFLVPLLLLTAVGDPLAELAPRPSWLDRTLLGEVGVDRFVLVCGVGLLQLSTANLLVRLLLDAIGVPARDNEKTLKGGRLLGPMERLFIVVLALAGELTAAAVVVAAKGLLRFPELQRSERDQGPSDVSEYFLIGSFASWLVALGGYALLRVAG